MILVLMGTNPYPFDRLAKAIEELSQEVDEDIIVQCGNTTFPFSKAEATRFMPRGRLWNHIKDARLIITQGGYGSITDCLSEGKPVIAVPRYEKFGEAKDDGGGQEEIVKALEESGHILGVYDIQELRIMFQSAYNFTPAGMEQSKIPDLVKDFVDNTMGRGK